MAKTNIEAGLRSKIRGHPLIRPALKNVLLSQVSTWGEEKMQACLDYLEDLEMKISGACTKALQDKNKRGKFFHKLSEIYVKIKYGRH
ncbi:MAG: hypothetical protein UY05_C0011G0010 [Candidatus Peregrinibacteria bacterium GW2011_GWA2_47_7]|nr:MAG: hypothetical protein UY05_C0011G0010 [Candidatus Peregrinibacteria bacterium GW2011_GWA2_47_7]